MKVFLSWSGDRSRAIADVLRQWIPSVLQAVKPYFSPDDILKGSRWASEVAKELDSSSVGLLVITPENQGAPWLLFEAGALAKDLDRSKVCPLLFGDMETTDLKGPLVQFQAAKFSREEMKKVVIMMNQELGDQALAGSTLDDVFEMFWPKLSDQIEKKLTAMGKPDAKAHRPDRDLLEEILALARENANQNGGRGDPTMGIGASDAEQVRMLAHYLGEMILLTQRRPPDKELANLVDEMSRIMEPLMETLSRRRRTYRYRFQNAEQADVVAKLASILEKQMGDDVS